LVVALAEALQANREADAFFRRLEDDEGCGLAGARDPLSEGFSHFVTSMTAPVASGWSVCRVGLAPTGKRRLFTAHTQTGQKASRNPAAQQPIRCKIRPVAA
jgi:hypothetical protein